MSLAGGGVWKADWLMLLRRKPGSYVVNYGPYPARPIQTIWKRFATL